MMTPGTTDNMAQAGTAKKAAFLAAFVETARVSSAVKAAGIGRRTHYNWLAADPDYAQSFEEAELRAAKVLEEEARRRAIAGTLKYRFDAKGNPIKHPKTGKPYAERVYSDNLLMFLLKGLAPHKYRDRSETFVHDDGPTLAHMERMQQMMEIIANSDRTETERLIEERVQRNVARYNELRRSGG